MPALERATRSPRPDLFEQFLDLDPLRGRRRGLVTCIFHRDRRPSLSIDLDARVSHCFGCGAQGGVLKFAELVGERLPAGEGARATAPTVHELAIRLAQSQPWARPGVLDGYHIADAVRRRRRLVDRARLAASVAGDRPQIWRILDAAAAAEREAWWLEAELDGFMTAAGGAR